MSDTPKTDKLAKRDFVPEGVWIRHARQLERENAALRSLLREAVTDYELLGGTCDGVETEDYIARVKAALRKEGQS